MRFALLFKRRVTSALSFIQCIARLIRLGHMILVCHSYTVMWMIGKQDIKSFIHHIALSVTMHDNKHPAGCTDDSRRFDGKSDFI